MASLKTALYGLVPKRAGRGLDADIEKRLMLRFVRIYLCPSAQGARRNPGSQEKPGKPGETRGTGRNPGNREKPEKRKEWSRS